MLLWLKRNGRRCLYEYPMQIEGEQGVMGMDAEKISEQVGKGKILKSFHACMNQHLPIRHNIDLHSY